MSKKEPGRNASCPCGSGRKYKNCCMGKTAKAAPNGRSWRWYRWPGIILLLTVIVGAGLWAMAPNTESGNSAQTPTPWQYDEANNRHWHPIHQHWHNGPPPQGVDSASATQPTSTPAPWEYDAENNRHWHPGHQHWHRGRPPANPGANQTPLPGTGSR
jgi:hypothetical protein